MNDVTIKDIKRKTNLDRSVLEQAATSAYAALAKQSAVGSKSTLQTEELAGTRKSSSQSANKGAKN